MILANMPLVNKIAQKYSIPKLEFGDTLAYGTIGLIKAVDNYDPTAGKFSTYAGVRIRGAILDYARSVQGRSRSGEIIQFKKEIEKQSHETMGPADELAVADKMGLSVKRMKILKAAMGISNLTLRDNMHDKALEEHPAPEEPGRDYLELQMLEEEVSKLGRLKRRLLIYHYIEGLNMKETAKRLNRKESRVSQMKKEIEQLLYKRLKKRGVR